MQGLEIIFIFLKIEESRVPEIAHGLPVCIAGVSAEGCVFYLLK